MTTEEIKQSIYDAMVAYTLNQNQGAEEASKQLLRDYCMASATAIANVIPSESGGGGVDLNAYLKKSGGIDGIMTGLLTSNYDFYAGGNGSTGFKVYWDAVNEVIKNEFNAQVHINTDKVYAYTKSAFLFGTDIISINPDSQFTNGVFLGDMLVRAGGSFQVGATNTSGLFVNETIAEYQGHGIYHSGNSNISTIDWSMKDAIISGAMTVSGISTFNGSTSMLYGFQAGESGVKKVEAITSGLEVFGNVYLPSTGGIISRTNDAFVFSQNSFGDTLVNASSRNLILGSLNTLKVYLGSTLTSENGSRNLIDKFGLASFNWGFSGGIDDTKTIEAISRGPLTTDKGTLFYNFLDIASDKTRIATNGSYDFVVTTNGLSMSIGKNISSTQFTTSGIAYIFDKPMWSESSVGVLGTKTKLTENTLFLGEDLLGTPHYILNVSDGIKIFGQTYFEGDAGTALFATGFSGYGWRVTKDTATATFDEVVARKKFRAYSMEIQKIDVVSGSLWVSSSCSGDRVEEII